MSFELGESIPPDTAHVSLLAKEGCKGTRKVMRTGRERIIAFLEIQCGLRRGREMGCRSSVNRVSEVRTEKNTCCPLRCPDTDALSRRRNSDFSFIRASKRSLLTYH